MRSLLKITLIIFGAVLAVLLFCVVSVFLIGALLFGGLGGCSSQITEKITSPDHQNVAYVMNRDCGATAGSNDLAIYPPGRSPSRGNVFSCDDGRDFQAYWKNSRELVISYPKDAEVIELKTEVNGIKIDYVLTQPESGS